MNDATRDPLSYARPTTCRVRDLYDAFLPRDIYQCYCHLRCHLEPAAELSDAHANDHGTLAAVTAVAHRCRDNGHVALAAENADHENCEQIAGNISKLIYI